VIAIERYYRHELMIERLAEILKELTKTADTLYRIEDGPELEHLTHADRLLKRIIRQLHEAQDKARLQCEPLLLETQFRASIELVHSSPERLRARENGERA
jgi:hypothetical protein